MPKTNLAQLAIALQTDAQTPVALTDADVLLELREGYAFEPTANKIPIGTIREVSSSPGQTTTTKTIDFNVAFNVVGPGNLTSTPALDRYLRAALFERFDAYTVAIGAIADGPFLAGETVNAAPSGAEIVVIKRGRNGDGTLAFKVTSGSVASGDTLTGATSAATATASANEVRTGSVYQPVDPDPAAQTSWVSLGGARDGKRLYGNGQICGYTFEFQNAEFGQLALAFTGAWGSGSVTHEDAGLWTNAVYSERGRRPGRFKQAGIYLDDYLPVGVIGITLGSDNGIAIVGDAQNDSGILHADYNRIDNPPSITLEPDQTVETDFPFFDSFESDSEHNLEWSLDGPEGVRWTFTCRRAQITELGFGEREPRRATYPMTLVANGDANDEVFIWQH